MKILIESSQKLEIKSIEDIGKLVPVGMQGRALNYGQGEGQFQIGNFIWGIYVESSQNYCLQFEEVYCSLHELQYMLSGIMKQIEAEFKCFSNYTIKGACEEHEPHEKYLS